MVVFFFIPKIINSKLNVCIGSGSGIVPSLMYEANGSRTVLIDALNGINGNSVETSHFYDTWLRVQYPDMEIINRRSDEVCEDFITIDYLHIDGDHSYTGVKADWELYSPLVRINGYVTIHDTDTDYLEQFDWFHMENRWDGGPGRLVDELKANESWEQFSIHDKQSTGITILKRIR